MDRPVNLHVWFDVMSHASRYKCSLAQAFRALGDSGFELESGGIVGFEKLRKLFSDIEKQIFSIENDLFNYASWCQGQYKMIIEDHLTRTGKTRYRQHKITAGDKTRFNEISTFFKANYSYNKILSGSRCHYPRLLSRKVKFKNKLTHTCGTPPY